jgi:transposase
MMKQVYGEEALGRSAVFKWHQRFAQGTDSLEDDERSGRPKAVRTERKIEEVATSVRA